MGTLTDKIAIVTGAGQGIGRAIAEKLAAEGATVVITDIDGAMAEATAKEIGGEAIGLATDVTDRGAVAAMVDAVRERFGRIDVLVNNAGWDKAQPFVESRPGGLGPGHPDQPLRRAQHVPRRVAGHGRPGVTAPSSTSGPTPDGSAPPARPCTRRPRAG